MHRIAALLAPMAAAAVLGVAAAPSSACGCGIALGAQGPTERAFVGFASGREDLVVSLGLKARSHAAVVLPVPATPKVGLAPSGSDLFKFLKKSTAPKTVTKTIVGGPPSGSGGGGTGTPPIVIGTKTIGGYTITRLEGGTSAALYAWLNAHGYTLPAAAAPILSDYVRHGWSFVAIRIAKRSTGQLEPLRIRFATARPVYPMRLDQLSAEPVTLDLWLAGAHRVVARPLRTDFAGPLPALAATAPAGVRRYLAGAWLTALSGDSLDPSEMHHDILPRAAPRDTAYRRTIVHYVYTGTAASR